MPWPRSYWRYSWRSWVEPARRPALIHGLWLVVMLKLVTPPVVPVTLPGGMSSLINSLAGEWRRRRGLTIASQACRNRRTKALLRTPRPSCAISMKRGTTDSSIPSIDSSIDATALGRFDSPSNIPLLE